jgi:hypothetical protein
MEEVMPRLQQFLFVRLNQTPQSAKFDSGKTFIALQPNRAEPELRLLGFALRVHVWRLVLVRGVTQQAVRSDALPDRHPSPPGYAAIIGPAVISFS